MLFNSYTFVFLFLPITLAIFYFLARIGGPKAAILWLVVASLFFYGWWAPPVVLLLVASVAFNYAIGQALLRQEKTVASKSVLAGGVGANLILLGYFKYVGFFANTISALFGTNLVVEHIVLPLAISFFTFQQIAYIVDCYRKHASRDSFWQYLLFVAFFPQLIAGPICHHDEMMPQYRSGRLGHFEITNLSVGITIFAIGLFKKAVLADGISVFSDTLFDAASRGVPLTFAESWTGALAYTFQIYFDFSGYSDMAIGLGRMFGFRLPLNFHSPYRATNIIEFWRRWHMTLSRFLRDYLYFPLGGNRKGPGRRYVNLMIVMLLGGLWHGAGWTFVCWGALHGAFLVVNHGWHAVKHSLWPDAGPGGRWRASAAQVLTFLCVIAGWVLFRAADFDAATVFYKGMIGMNGFLLPSPSAIFTAVVTANVDAMSRFYHTMFPNELLTEGDYLVPWLGGLLMLVWFAPNTQEIMRRYNPAIAWPREMRLRPGARIPTWRPTAANAVVVFILLVFSLSQLVHLNEFIYFQF